RAAPPRHRSRGTARPHGGPGGQHGAEVDRSLTDPASTERRIQVAAVATALVGTLPVFLTGALAVQIGRDISFGPSRLGVASGTFFAAAAAGSALMGRLAERIGPGRAMRLAAGANAVLMAVLAWTPTF